jgi:hypothetical protein
MLPLPQQEQYPLCQLQQLRNALAGCQCPCPHPRLLASGAGVCSSITAALSSSGSSMCDSTSQDWQLPSKRTACGVCSATLYR